MKNNWKYWLPCILVVAVYYLVPLLIQDTGSAMMILLILMPAAVLVIAFMQAWWNQKFILFALFCGIVMIPSLFIFYNSSAWIYVFAYAVIALIGGALGSLIKKSAAR